MFFYPSHAACKQVKVNLSYVLSYTVAIHVMLSCNNNRCSHARACMRAHVALCNVCIFARDLVCMHVCMLACIIGNHYNDQF